MVKLVLVTILVAFFIIMSFVMWCLCAITKISDMQDEKFLQEYQHEISDLSDIEKQTVNEIMEYHKSKADKE